MPRAVLTGGLPQHTLGPQSREHQASRGACPGRRGKLSPGAVGEGAGSLSFPLTCSKVSSPLGESNDPFRDDVDV